MVDPKDLGPLAPLVGTWEGDAGLDVAYAHARETVYESIYRERTSFSSFGPVDNGSQSLFGLDYRSAMWRDDEENPFHTEIGYWLWDAATSQVMKSFMIPRGVTLIAGGPSEASASTFHLRAADGDEEYGIVQNRYLMQAAKTLSYDLTVTIDGDTFTYDQTTVLRMNEFPELFDHTDHNTLHRTS